MEELEVQFQYRPETEISVPGTEPASQGNRTKAELEPMQSLVPASQGRELELCH